jgi:hypothetical protein
MKTNLLRDMRELTDKEVTSVAGGLLGEIPGYNVSLPAGLFVDGYSTTTHDGVPGGTVQNLYTGASGWVY